MILMVVLINANGREHRSAMILMVVLINANADDLSAAPFYLPIFQRQKQNLERRHDNYPTSGLQIVPPLSFKGRM